MRRAVPLVFPLLVILGGRIFGQAPSPILLKPARVFDGADLATQLHGVPARAVRADVPVPFGRGGGREVLLEQHRVGAECTFGRSPARAAR